MQALLKILTILAEVLQLFVRKREVAKRDEEIQKVKVDPAGEFASEFGGVRKRSSQAGVSGNKTDVGIDEY